MDKTDEVITKGVIMAIAGVGWIANLFFYSGWLLNHSTTQTPPLGVIWEMIGIPIFFIGAITGWFNLISHLFGAGW